MPVGYNTMRERGEEVVGFANNAFVLVSQQKTATHSDDQLLQYLIPKTSC